MRPPHLVPEHEMSQEELVKRYELCNAPDPPPLPPAKRQQRRQRLIARMARYVPSERNRRIFEDVVIKHQIQENVAFRERISRQHVARIVQRMRDWYAFWGGEDAGYGPDQQQRLANHVATQELTEYQRQLQKELAQWPTLTEKKKLVFKENKEQAGSVIGFQSHGRPTQLYRLLLATILARAKLSGAGVDYALGAVSGGGANPAMVVQTAINVNQALASTPPKGEVHSDKPSELTCDDAATNCDAITDDSKKSYQHDGPSEQALSHGNQTPVYQVHRLARGGSQPRCRP